VAVVNKIIFNNIDASLTDDDLARIEKNIFKKTTVGDRRSGNIVKIEGILLGFGSPLLDLDEGMRVYPVNQIDKKDKIITIN